MSNKSLKVLKVKDFKKVEHPLDKDLPDLLPRHPYFNITCAGPRQGKTCLLMNKIFGTHMYNGQEYFDTIYFISPSQMHDQTCCHILPKFDNVIRIHEVEDIMNLKSILEHIVKGQKDLIKKDEEMERILIILDDCVSFLKPIEVLSTKYRHVGLSFEINVQSFRSCPLLIRNCASSMTFFKLHNMREMEKIDEEFGQNYTADFIPLAQSVTNEKYNFVFMNHDKMIMYKNFDEVLIDAT